MELIQHPGEQYGHSISVSFRVLSQLSPGIFEGARRVWIDKELVIDRTGANPHLDDRLKKD